MLRRTTKVPLCKALHSVTFPEDDWEDAEAYWLLTDDDTGAPLGFCSVRRVRFESAAFLTRAGILPRVRGRGVQRKMIRVREAWAKKKGYRWVITYVHRENFPSVANLIKCGYTMYTPAYKYAGDNVIYFRKGIYL